MKSKGMQFVINRCVRISIGLVLVLSVAISICGCGSSGSDETADKTTTTEAAYQIDENGTYDSKDDVAEYILAYDRLPSNYMTKKEARSLGWESGSVEKFSPGSCIGGDRFGNYEGNLPPGEYIECDIDTLGEDSRGAKRLVFSDEAIYYTEDHYGSFEKVYDR